MRQGFVKSGADVARSSAKYALGRDVPARLLAWYRANARDLPWRTDRDPYHVWLSEIMLQQTRVEAVVPYYERFLSALPTIERLAATGDDALMKLWEGLGYYSRARNLKKAAVIVVDRHGGRFPRTYEEIRALPGVGEYTAGAIASICFGLPYPAVDGNVLRVAARLLEIGDSVDEAATKRDIRSVLMDCYGTLDGRRVGDLTQSLMEFGALVCTPGGAPDCAHCPLPDLCSAKRQGRTSELPVRTGKKPRRVERRTVFVLKREGLYAIRKRPGEGLLAGLYELPNVEGQLSENAAHVYVSSLGLIPVSMEAGPDHAHIFTHIRWEMRSYIVTCAPVMKPAPPEPTAFSEPRSGETEGNLIWASPDALRTRYALPSAFIAILAAGAINNRSNDIGS